MGQNNTTPYSSPVQIPGSAWSNIGSCASENDFFAIKTDGTLWSWGFNVNNGTLAQNNRTDYSSPVQIPGTTWDTGAGGQNFSVTTKTDGTIWAWGNNTYGQIGQNTGFNDGADDYSSPVQVGSDAGWSEPAAAAYDVFAKKTL